MRTVLGPARTVNTLPVCELQPHILRELVEIANDGESIGPRRDVSAWGTRGKVAKEHQYGEDGGDGRRVHADGAQDGYRREPVCEEAEVCLWVHGCLLLTRIPGGE